MRQMRPRNYSEDWTKARKKEMMPRGLLQRVRKRKNSRISLRKSKMLTGVQKQMSEEMVYLTS